MKGRAKRKLHSTPPEFTVAAEHKAEQQRLLACRYLPDIVEEEARRERIRNMKMPAHRPKSRRGRVVEYGMFRATIYEDDLPPGYLEELRARMRPRSRKRGGIG